MATVPSLHTKPPMPSSPRNNKCRTAAEGSLRSSCESCASSKVKCSGRKPACHRCEKRGFVCEYQTAKRAGRKPAGATSSTSSGSSSRPSQDVERSPEVTFASPKGTASEFSDCLRDLFGSMEPSLCPTLTQTGSSMDASFQSMTPAFQMDLSHFDFSNTESLFSSGTDTSSNGFGNLFDASFGSNDAMSELLTFPLPTPEPTTTSTSPSRELSVLRAIPDNVQACSCLAQALGLMTQLSQLLSTAKKSWTTDLDSTVAIQTVQDVLGHNKSAVAAVSSMLSCPCSHDGYLLVITSLILFRVMGLFAAVVLKTPSSPPKNDSQPVSSTEPSRRSSAVSETYNIEGKDWARMSAQAVLSELHNVRRLTKVLSSKLSLEASRPREGSENEIPKNTALDWEVRLPLSENIYGQLEADLNRGLRTLSQGIIERLRSF